MVSAFDGGGFCNTVKTPEHGFNRMFRYGFASEYNELSLTKLVRNQRYRDIFVMEDRFDINYYYKMNMEGTPSDITHGLHSSYLGSGIRENVSPCEVVEHHFNKFKEDKYSDFYTDNGENDIAPNSIDRKMMNNNRMVILKPDTTKIAVIFHHGNLCGDKNPDACKSLIQDSSYLINISGYKKDMSVVNRESPEYTRANYARYGGTWLMRCLHIFGKIDMNVIPYLVKSGNYHMLSMYTVTDSGDENTIIKYNPEVVTIVEIKENEFPIYNRKTKNLDFIYSNKYDTKTDSFYLQIEHYINRQPYARDYLGEDVPCESYFTDIHTGDKILCKHPKYPFKINFDNLIGHKALYRFDMLMKLGDCKSITPLYERVSQHYHYPGKHQYHLFGFIAKYNKWFLIRQEDISHDDLSGIEIGRVSKNQTFKNDNIKYECQVDYVERCIEEEDVKMGMLDENVRNKGINKLFKNKFFQAILIRGVNDFNGMACIYTPNDTLRRENKLINFLISNQVPVFHTKDLSEYINRTLHLVSHKNYDSEINVSIIETFGVLALKPGMAKLFHKCGYGDIFIAEADQKSFMTILQLRPIYADILGCKAIEYTRVFTRAEDVGDSTSPSWDPPFSEVNVILKCEKRLTDATSIHELIEFIEGQDEFNIYLSDSTNVGNCEHGTVKYGMEILLSIDLKVNRYYDLKLSKKTQDEILELCNKSVIYLNKDEVLFGLIKRDSIPFKTAVAHKMLQINKGGVKE